MSDLVTPSPTAPAPTAKITVWPADVLARHLASPEPSARIVALGMANQSGAPIDQCVPALLRCAELSQGDPLALKLVATALGSLAPACSNNAVQACLVALVAEAQERSIRIAAAHAMFRLHCLPMAGADSVCSMLFDADANARKVALLTLTPFAPSAAAAIAGRIAHTPPTGWTTEALFALARSAGTDTVAKNKVQGFVMRSLSGSQLLPTGIAGYAALAQLNPQGNAMAALAQVAGSSGDSDAARAALDALGDLGETARPVARQIANLLVATDDPVQEELLCQTLVRLRPPLRELPAQHIVQRVAGAPDRSAAAHCLLLCLYPKEFQAAAAVVRQRLGVASSALRQILLQVYKTLTGVDLAGVAATERN